MEQSEKDVERSIFFFCKQKKPVNSNIEFLKKYVGLWFFFCSFFSAPNSIYIFEGNSCRLPLSLKRWNICWSTWAICSFNRLPFDIKASIREYLLLLFSAKVIISKKRPPKWRVFFLLFSFRVHVTQKLHFDQNERYVNWTLFGFRSIQSSIFVCVFVCVLGNNFFHLPNHMNKRKSHWLHVYLIIYPQFSLFRTMCSFWMVEHSRDIWPALCIVLCVYIALGAFSSMWFFHTIEPGVL